MNRNMTQEEKQLLLKDLCARLPYGVKVKCGREILTLNVNWLQKFQYHLNEIKPYLRPMSSMTEEELYIIESNWAQLKDGNWLYECVDEITTLLNSHHLDVNDIIGKGMAIEAPEEMYKTE